MLTSQSKAFIDEAEALLGAIRGGVLVHLQDGVRAEHLKVPLDFARLLNAQVSQTEDHDIIAAADALEAWLMLLVTETEPLSDARTMSLLDQISELEAALFGHKEIEHTPASDVADFIDESFEILRSTSTNTTKNSSDSSKESDDFEVDSELLEVFNEEAKALLRSITLNLEVLSARPKDREALWEIKKSAHTFKGAAGIVGLKKLSDLAHRVEDLLEHVSEKNADLNVHIVGLLLNAAECLEALSNDERSPEIDARIDWLHTAFGKVLEAISNSERPGEEPVVPLPVPPPPKRRATDQFAAPRRTNSIVRVSVDRLDELVRNMRDLFASRTAFEQRLAELEQQLEESHNNGLRLLEASGKVEGLKKEIDLSGRGNWDAAGGVYDLAEAVKDAGIINTAFDNVKSNLEALYDAQSAAIDEIQERLLRLRNVEFGSIATRLQRTVRVTSDEEEKRAEVVIENGSLEVDTQLIDSLIEPLLHLLKNAVVHGIENPETRRILGKPEAGKITIRASNKGSYTVISVTDDGRGIAFRPLLEKALVSNLISAAEAELMTPEKILELIFLPGLTTAKKLNLNAGRGVGMSIVRESIAAAGGTISIETWPQKGTTFTVRIPRPLESQPSEPRNRPSDFPVASGRMRVMIVDDSPSVRLTTSRVVEKAGWHVETAKNGFDAMQKLKTLPAPNLILSDIEMPRMDGFEFVTSLREDESLKNIPVVFISSRADDVNRRQASAAGVADYLTKPYDQIQLLECINRLTQNAELAEAEESPLAL